MTLPIEIPLPPMEAKLVSELPAGDEWNYEPKWDGFRCVLFRDGADVYLQSKSCKPLARYFPELVEAAKRLKPKQFVLDGEIVVPVGGRLSFDDLLMRIHPAASRIRKLAAATPAWFVAFDALATGARTSLLAKPLHERRERLEEFATKYFDAVAAVRLSPVTEGVAQARRWLELNADLDGIVAKRVELPYRSGERDGMQKLKRLRTADCVVGGFRYSTNGRSLGSLLLGLFAPDGRLHHVGFTSSFNARQRKELLKKVEPLRGPPGFTGNAPGGPSRWATERSAEWESLRHELVVEVQYDHFTGGRFRHGTRLIRFRPDKAPEQCGKEQLYQ